MSKTGMNDKIELIKLHCEAGSILEHMNLFDDLKEITDSMELVGTYMGKDLLGFNVLEDPTVNRGEIRFMAIE